MRHNIKCKKLHPDAILPTYATPQSAGADLYSVEDITINKRATLVHTGIAVEIPYGFEAQIRPRSGLALKVGITVLNAPGTIDSDYRGEVCVMLHDTRSYAYPHAIKKGERIAQMVIAPVVQGDFLWVDELSETTRGEGGFGSTGNK